MEIISFAPTLAPASKAVVRSVTVLQLGGQTRAPLLQIDGCLPP